MNSNQINCFLAVAKHLSFSKAADELFIAQSSVSRSISQLEAEWDVTLFLRLGKSIALTDEGSEYLQLCQRYVDDFQHLRRLHRARRASATLKLQYSVFPAWSISRLLYDNAAQLSQRHPNWEISLKICQASRLVQELLQGNVDLIFHFGDLLTDQPQLARRTLLELPQIILYSAHSPLALKSRLVPDDFREQTFLYVPDEVLTPEMMGRQSRFFEKRYGFPLKLQSAENPDALSFALESNQGVALMDEWSRYRANPQLKSMAIDLPLPVVLAWRKDSQNAAIDAFVEETAAYFQQHIQ